MALPLDLEGTWLNPSTVQLDAGELRRADGAMFGGTGLALGASGGVVRHGDTSLAVSVDGSDVVTIQPGAVAIPGNAVSGTGIYRSAVPTATTGSLTARNATNGRIDLVVFRQLDTDVVPGHGAYKARVEIIAGTPSATPGVPTFPTMAVELARITVPPVGGGTATVDSSFRTYAHAAGAELIVPTSARLPASAATLQRARALDTGAKYYWDGSAWQNDGVFAQAAGLALVSGSSVAANGIVGTSITFPAGRFTQPPIVTFSIGGFVSFSALVFPKHPSSVTTSGATLNVINASGGTATWASLPLTWTAVQMTPTSAAG